MARTRSYRELIVWQKAMKLAKAAYRIANDLPRKEAFGLVAQLQRAAISVPSNIAEGHGRLTDLQFRHFLGNARGSLCELQTQIELAHDLGYIEAEELSAFMAQGSEVARLINGLITAMRDPRESSSGLQTPLTARSAANSASSARTGSHL
jgi:four helix bundle protein